VFGGYCLKTITHSDWPLYTCETVEAGSKDYLVIFGINEPAGAESFKIFPYDYPPSAVGEPPRDYSGADTLYEGTVEAPLLVVEPITSGQADSVYRPEFIHYYDENGNELDRYELAAQFGNEGQSGGGTAYSYQGTLYVFCAIVLLLAFLVVRYFLTP